MHFLLLCILSSTGIFVIFKSLNRFNLPSFPVIVINYLLACVLGFVINAGGLDMEAIKNAEWLPMSMLIGFLFILMFFLVAYSSRKAGISVTTVASKMSVLFPIIFSMLIDSSDHLTPVKGAAILLTLFGVGLTVYKPGEGVSRKTVLYIPLLLFVGMGIVDSLVKFAQHRSVGDEETALFSAVLFLNAFVAGFIILLFTPRNFRHFKKPAVWASGLLLGGVNFGSIYFIMRALNYTSDKGAAMDSSVIFGMNNTGIVALSVLTGLLVFRERLSLTNWIGVVLSALALILFSFG